MASGLEPGQQFGLWTVVELSGKYSYLCKCDCGVTKRVRKSDLLGGKSRMCRQCSIESTNTTHGMRNTQEYNTWVHMIQRCTNPNNKDYANYGGRGIEVCDLWRNSFEAFYMSIGPKPTDEHTIERINTNGNYEPGNVKWATRAEQTVNQRNNVNLTIDGETKTVSQWSRDARCPVNQHTIYKRLDRGWDVKKAVFAPSSKVS